jgi:hypothetical protein
MGLLSRQSQGASESAEDDLPALLDMPVPFRMRRSHASVSHDMIKSSTVDTLRVDLLRDASLTCRGRQSHLLELLERAGKGGHMAAVRGTGLAKALQAQAQVYTRAVDLVLVHDWHRSALSGRRSEFCGQEGHEGLDGMSVCPMLVWSAVNERSYSLNCCSQTRSPRVACRSCSRPAFRVPWQLETMTQQNGNGWSLQGPVGGVDAAVNSHHSRIVRMRTTRHGDDECMNGYAHGPDDRGRGSGHIVATSVMVAVLVLKMNGLLLMGRWS